MTSSGGKQGNRYLAEGLGTFALVFMGCGAVVVDAGRVGMLGHTGVSLAFGLAVMSMVYSVGNISGAHINPAVTLGFLFAGRQRGRTVVPYMISQFAGAIAAAALLRLLFQDSGTLGETIPSVSPLRAFALETVLTFILMLVILNVSTGHMEKGIMAGVAVGGTVALAALVGGPLTGASMNPARTLGPAIVSGRMDQVWIYLTAPVVGAFLAFPTCRWIQGSECCRNDENVPE